MDNFFLRKAKIVSYIEEELELLSDENNTVVLRTNNPYISDIPRITVNRILNVMVDRDASITIKNSNKIIDTKTSEDIDVYTIDVLRRGFSSYASAVRSGAEANDEIAFRLELGEGDEIYLTGPELRDRKFNIFDTDRSKQIKDIFIGLLRHINTIENSNPIKKETYKQQTILAPLFGNIDKDLITQYEELYLPEQIQKHMKRFFQKIYRYFITKNKDGTLIFRPAITYKNLKTIKEKIGEDQYILLFTKVLQESFSPDSLTS